MLLSNRLYPPLDRPVIGRLLFNDQDGQLEAEESPSSHEFAWWDVFNPMHCVLPRHAWYLGPWILLVRSDQGQHYGPSRLHSKMSSQSQALDFPDMEYLVLPSTWLADAHQS